MYGKEKIDVDHPVHDLGEPDPFDEGEDENKRPVIDPDPNVRPELDPCDDKKIKYRNAFEQSR